MNAEISRLIATGKAQPGVYIGASAINVLKVPEGKGIIIYGIKMRSFCDLQPGRTFINSADVDTHLWHQLRVISKKAIVAYQMKWDINPVIQGATTFYLPIGNREWETWINAENNIIFEISSAGDNQKSYNNTIAALSAKTDQPYPQPPHGYGKATVAGSIPVVETIRNGGIPAGQFEFRAFNDYTQPNVASRNSFDSFQWPLTTNNVLNAPQFGITFGMYTAPLLEVNYILFNKQPTANFAPPL